MEIKNDGRLKICWMRLVGYQQFQDVFLDFTHPETGEPLDKICLIGANGTGKTVVLNRILHDLIVGHLTFTKVPEEIKVSLLIFKFKTESGYLWGINSNRFRGNAKFELEIDSTLQRENDANKLLALFKESDISSQAIYSQDGWGKRLGDNLLYQPTESDVNSYSTFDDVPTTNLSNALEAAPMRRLYSVIGQGEILDFWNTLLWHISMRMEKRAVFDSETVNKTRLLGDLDKEFDAENPKILERLSVHWNRILEKAGLEFDFENAKLPFRLDQNLYAYIRLKKPGNQQIPYKKLSTGIRNYIFSIGHIFSLYFQREVHRGFLLVDEPENGLFPDFLYDLVDVYRQVTTDKNGENNTQMFFATHEPIIAAQFEPYERIILEWNDDGTVRTRRGYSPIGDDPNDLLKKDFAVASLMGEKGNAAWQKFLQLSDLLDEDLDAATKNKVMNEYMEIGNKYNFPAS